ncbi:MAG: endonuclease/exonuclease/phosphatase family protein [Planctomycetota bacterium]
MSRYRSNRALIRGAYGWVATAAALAALVGASGWAMPDLPVVGPLVQKLLANRRLTVAKSDSSSPKAAGVASRSSAEDASSGADSGLSDQLPTGDSTGLSRSVPKSSVGGSSASTPSGLSIPTQPDRAAVAGTGAAGTGKSGKLSGVGGNTRPPPILADGATAFPPSGGLLGAGSPTVPESPGESATRLVTPPADKISIASYNIQVFGTTKLQQNDLREILARTVRQFDVVAIQEVRSKDDTVLPRFLQAVNADGSRYDYVLGPRLGRTTSKEQYAFVYNTQRIELDSNSVATVGDPQDLLHREPLAARFRARTQPPEAGFTFWLVNIHTDPDEVPQEVDALADVFAAVANANPQEDDVILLGDLNADETQFGRLGTIPGIAWIVPRTTTTNTRATKTYDNLLFLREATAEFTGRWGVVNMQRAFQLSLDDALRVSDHLPVWGEFSVWEVPRPPVGGGAPFAPR